MTGPLRVLVALFALALAVRVTVGLATGIGGPPVEDERGYTLLAQSLADGRGFELPVPGASVAPRTSFRAPLVPLLFAPFAAAGADVTDLRLVSMVAGALGAPLLWLALRRSPLGRHAIWPALAYALWPPAVYVSVRAISEPFSQALLLGSVALLPAASSRASAGAGALAALSVLARPAALLPAAALAIAAGRLRRGMLFAVAFAAVLAPWALRNAQIHGRLLLTTNSGVTLVGGNSEAAANAQPPGKWLPPERVYSGEPDPPDLGMWGWSGLSEEASDRRFTADAVAFVRDHPADAARLGTWKIVRLFDPDTHSEKADAGTKRLVGWLTLAPVLLLAAVGLTGAQKTRWALLLAGTVATALLFYGDTRMRTAADPALLVLATHGALAVGKPRAARRVDSAP